MIVSIYYMVMSLSALFVDGYITTSISRSSFVGRQRHTLDPTITLSKRTIAAATITTTSTSLHMNLFDRFSRVAKSNLNNILQSLEDPEKIMTQALEDMQVRFFFVVNSDWCKYTDRNSHHFFLLFDCDKIFAYRRI